MTEYTETLAEDRSNEVTLSDSVLIEMIVALRQSARELGASLKNAEAELLRRMEEKKAAVLLNHAYNVKLTPNVKYEFDDRVLERLRGLIPDTEFGEAIKSTYKVNKTKLNAIHKYGGEVAGIIDKATTKIELTPKLEIEEKK